MPNLMDAVKVASTLGINRSRRAKGPAWQPRYFDRIVRNVGEYHKTMEYMHLNPCGGDWSSGPRIGCGQAFTLTAARVPSACRWTRSSCRRTKGHLSERETESKRKTNVVAILRRRLFKVFVSHGRAG